MIIWSIIRMSNRVPAFSNVPLRFHLPCWGACSHSDGYVRQRTALRMLPPKCALSTARLLLSDLSHQPKPVLSLSPLQQYSKLSPKVPHSANPTKRVYKRIYILTATDGVLPVMPALQPFVQFNGSRSHFLRPGVNEENNPFKSYSPPCRSASVTSFLLFVISYISSLSLM